MTDRNETQDEREDRELIELLNELRIVLPGVQVLFAFLLTLPFTATFQKLGTGEEVTYLVALFTTAFTSVLLMTPTAFHRIRFRQGDKEALIRQTNRFTLAGMASLSVSMVSVIWLVCQLVLSQAAASVIGVMAAIVIVSLWFAIPVWRQARGERRLLRRKHR